MRIIVDADACPGRNIIEKVAEKYDLKVIMYCDLNHVLRSDYKNTEIIYMDSGFQSVDMKIANECKAGDIVVTQDYGVAAMVLGKKSLAINPKGYIYNNENIDRLLFERHLSGKARRGGGRTSGPKKRSDEDNKRLEDNLIYLIEKNISL